MVIVNFTTISMLLSVFIEMKLALRYKTVFLCFIFRINLLFLTLEVEGNKKRSLTGLRYCCFFGNHLNLRTTKASEH